MTIKKIRDCDYLDLDKEDIPPASRSLDDDDDDDDDDDGGGGGDDDDVDDE